MAYNTIQEERKHSLQMKTIVVVIIIQRINNLFLSITPNSTGKMSKLLGWMS